MDESRTAPGRPLWERLEQIRLSNGWNRVRLAREAGVDRTTIDKWRYQPRSPQPPTVKTVASNLGIDDQEALRLAGIATPQAPSAGPADEEREDPHDRLERLARELREIRGDPADRARLRALLEEGSSSGGEDDLFEVVEGESRYDRAERMLRYLQDPGPRGTVLRELLATWGDSDTP